MIKSHFGYQEDRISSEDTETGEKSLKKVLDVIVSETDNVVHITTGENEITTTQNHPFYVEGKGWTAASELEEGDVLHTKEGVTTVVQRVEVEQLEEAVKVYNLEVEDGHTYYVTDERVLVHNDCGNDDRNDGNESGKKSNEIKLPTESTHDSARNTLLKEIEQTGAFKNGSNKYIGRLESSYGYGKQIGRQSLDGKIRWRLDFDNEIGVHYNFEDFSK